MKKTVDATELEAIYQGITLAVEAECEFTTKYVGGQPADEKGLEAFCRHHLKLSDDEIPSAMARISRDELIKSKEGDEVEERESYGVNVIRRCEKGPWIGNWQIKACIKCACSRLGLFAKKKGAKGDMSHLGKIEAIGNSLWCPIDSHVHMYNGNGPVGTTFEKFMGSVQGPTGRVSIVHDSEIVEPGTKFAFRLRVPPLQFDETAIKLIFSTIGVIGLGSVKALENGKFKVLSLTYEFPEVGKKSSKKDE